MSNPPAKQEQKWNQIARNQSTKACLIANPYNYSLFFVFNLQVSLCCPRCTNSQKNNHTQKKTNPWNHLKRSTTITHTIIRFIFCYERNISNASQDSPLNRLSISIRFFILTHEVNNQL